MARDRRADESLRHAGPREGVAFDVDEGLSVPIAPVPVIAVLKMISYLDRPAERERDLRDLAHTSREVRRPGGREAPCA